MHLDVTKSTKSSFPHKFHFLLDLANSKFRTSPSVFDVQADSFFVGKTNTQFISGSGEKIEISSSNFHLTSEGNVTASNILLGDKGGSQFLQFVGSTLTVQGDITANTIRTPASIGGATSTDLNASSSIDENGLATFKSASIAGWDITPTEIKKGTNVSLDSTNKECFSNYINITTIELNMITTSTSIQ